MPTGTIEPPAPNPYQVRHPWWTLPFLRRIPVGHWHRRPDEIYPRPVAAADEAERPRLPDTSWTRGPEPDIDGPDVQADAEETSAGTPEPEAEAQPDAWHTRANTGRWPGPEPSTEAASVPDGARPDELSPAGPWGGPAAREPEAEQEAEVGQAYATRDTDADITADLADDDLDPEAEAAAEDIEEDMRRDPELAAALDSYDTDGGAAFRKWSAHAEAEYTAGDALDELDEETRTRQQDRDEADAEVDQRIYDAQQRAAEDAQADADIDPLDTAAALLRPRPGADAEAVADDGPVMGSDYYTATPGSAAHRKAYADYAEASGGVLGLEEYTVDEAYTIDNAAELDIERWYERMGDGDPDAEADATDEIAAHDLTTMTENYGIEPETAQAADVPAGPVKSADSVLADIDAVLNTVPGAEPQAQAGEAEPEPEAEIDGPEIF